MKIIKRFLAVAVAAMILPLSQFSSASADLSRRTSIDFGEMSVSGISEYGYASVEKVNMKKSSANSSSKKDIAQTSYSLPSTFGSINNEYMEPAIQQRFNDCWAVASASACESSLIKNNGFKKEDINISELILPYFSYNNAYSKNGLLDGDGTYLTNPNTNCYDFGGNGYFSTMLLARWQGLIDESSNNDVRYKYTNTSDALSIMDTLPSSVSYGDSLARLRDAYWIPSENAEQMKRHLMEVGDLTMTIGYYDDYYNEDTASYYCPDSMKSKNHEIQVVGWDDNYSKDNFIQGSRPSNNGAWLCKNSWSKNWGIEGYFYISYEDATIPGGDVFGYRFDTVEKYDNIYQYDGTNSISYFHSETCEEANIYTAQKKEALRAVGFYLLNQSGNYTIRVFRSVDTLPTDGTLVEAATVSGSVDSAGFHKIDLPSVVELEENEKFSVVIELTATDGYETYLIVDSSSDIIEGSPEPAVKYINKTEKGQSFMGTRDEDLYDYYEQSFCARIKAYTSDYRTLHIPETDKYTAVPSKTTYYAGEPITVSFEPTGNYYSFSRWGFESKYPVSYIDCENTDTTVTISSYSDITLAPMIKEKCIFGDADGDKIVTISDATLIQRALAKMVELKKPESISADVDSDSVVTIVDVSIIQNYLARMPKPNTFTGLEYVYDPLAYSG